MDYEVLFIIKEADPETLKRITKDGWVYDNLAMDATHVFSNGTVIPDANVKDFDPEAWYEILHEKKIGTTKTGIEGQ